MCLVVEGGGGRWLADVGFGSQTLRTPLPWVDGAADEQDGWPYRLVRSMETWRLQSRNGDGWFDLYLIDESPQHLVDFEVANHFTATHPSSPFVGRLIAQHRGPGARLGLIDTELTTTCPGGAGTSRRVRAGEVPAILVRDFGIRLTAAERAAIVHTLERRT